MTLRSRRTFFGLEVGLINMQKHGRQFYVKTDI